MHNRSDPGQGSGPPRYPGSFMLALREAADGLGWQIRRWLGSAVECVDAGGEERVVGLENLFRRARREDRATWPELIRDFLTRVSSGEFDNMPEDLATVADRLLVRVGRPMTPPRQLSPAGKEEDKLRVWFHPLVGADLGASLVVDYPQSMAYVTEEMIAQSGSAGRRLAAAGGGQPRRPHTGRMPESAGRGLRPAQLRRRRRLRLLARPHARSPHARGG
jgi:hypothetical protein